MAWKWFIIGWVACFVVGQLVKALVRRYLKKHSIRYCSYCGSPRKPEGICSSRECREPLYDYLKEGDRMFVDLMEQ